MDFNKYFICILSEGLSKQNSTIAILMSNLNQRMPIL